MRVHSKAGAFILAVILALGVFGAGLASAEAERPDTWIADRRVEVQVYVDDVGDTLPDDQANSPVLMELKRRTGIELVVNYTPGEKDRYVMAAQLAAGIIPDVIVSYLNNSTRPEFPILLKAAKDGMFADLSPYFADSQVYKRYLEDGYLPNDTKKNIMWREDFGGSVYFVHLSIDAVDKYMEFDPQENSVGGAFIQESIAEALELDVMDVKTIDDFYNLLVRIKEGGFTDNNGNPVTPLGPKYWGGSPDAIEECMKGLFWGVSDFYNLTEDGEVRHEVETEWAWKRVEFMRKLLAEGLMHPEFFTMDTTRALEFYTNNSGAVMGDVNNFVPLIAEKGGWLPLAALENWSGSSENITAGKTGYGQWCISADAKNPEEIFKLFDYLSTYEGQILCFYGIEGDTYTMVDGQPRLTEKALDWVTTNNKDAMINQSGASFDGSGNYFLKYMLTNRDSKGFFGESNPGMSGSTWYENSIAIGEKYPYTRRLVEGLKASAYLSDESMAAIKEKVDLLNYRDTLVQAVYAPTDEDAMKILDTFKTQLQDAGIADFEAYVGEIYKNDPKAVQFY